MLPARAAPHRASRRMLCPRHKPIDLGKRPGPLPSCGGAPRREKVGAGGGWLCGAVREQLYFPSCERGAAPALPPRVCPAGRRCPGGRVPARRRCWQDPPRPRGPPEHRQPPALCAGLRQLALFAGMNVSARSGEQGAGMVQTNDPPQKSAGGDGDGDGDCDSAGHKQPAGAAALVSLGRAPRGAPGCSGI